jgi:hypothetical protein
MDSSWGKADAKRIYAAARPSYHAVTVNTLDGIVKESQMGLVGLVGEELL